VLATAVVAVVVTLEPHQPPGGARADRGRGAADIA
jgi:hypothetical protein